jgi:putative membrane protein
MFPATKVRNVKSAMPSKFKQFLQGWVINTLAVLVAVYLVKGIHFQKPLDLLVASLVLGILNSFLRPIIMLLALPLLIFTLGLFMLVINAVLLYFVGFLLQPHFYVDGFWAAFKGALIISIVSLALNFLTGSSQSRIQVHRGRQPPGRDHRDGGDGPVIDV